MYPSQVVSPLVFTTTCYENSEKASEWGVASAREDIWVRKRKIYKWIWWWGRASVLPFTSLSLDPLMGSALCQVQQAEPPQRCPLVHTHTLLLSLSPSQFTCIIVVMQCWASDHPTLCTEAETNVGGVYWLGNMRWRREQSERGNEGKHEETVKVTATWPSALESLRHPPWFGVFAEIWALKKKRFLFTPIVKMAREALDWEDLVPVWLRFVAQLLGI